MNRFILLARIFLCRIFSSTVFIISIDNGTLKKIKGPVSNSFMSDCIEIIKRNKVKSGLIYLVRNQHLGNILKTSGNISNHVLQQLRNTWNFKAQ